jgi:hypothetical protein
VPAVPLGVGEDPGVAPGLLVPDAAAQPLVPAAVGGDQRRSRLLLPHVQVAGGGGADGLEELAVDHGDAGVEQPPAAVAAPDHAAGPGRHVVEGRRLRGDDHIADVDPVAEVVGGGMADGGLAVAPSLVLQRPGGEQEEQVVAVAVIRQPEVPHPGVGELEHGSPLDLGRGCCCCCG